MIVKKQVLLTDAGANWTTANGLTNKRVYASCQLATGKIIISVYGGLYYSNDNGTNWALLYSIPSATVTVLCVTSTGRILAGDSNGNIYYSDDNGETWTTVTNTGMPRLNYLYVTHTGRIYSATGDSNNATASIYYSDDNGITWVLSTSLEYGALLTICETSAGRIIIGGYFRDNNHVEKDILYSDDNGETWVKIDTGSYGVYNFCIMPTGRIIAAADGGVFYSDDNDESWNRFSDSHTGSKYISIVSTATGRLIVGLQAEAPGMRDGIWYSDDNGETWIKSNAGSIYGYMLLVLKSGRVLVGYESTAVVKYSDPVVVEQPEYASRPITKKEVDVLVEECKAYIQSKKQS